MKYKVGDKVRIKSFDWYNENKDKIDEVTCGNTNFIPDMVKYCKEIVTISSVLPTLEVYHIKEDGGMFNWADEMIEGLVKNPIILNGKEVMLKLANIELPNGSTTFWDLPNGYIFKDENGNIINATKIILEKKKKEYPKTYEECYRILDMSREYHTNIGYKWELINNLQKLLICRDVYWKIAGEEMRLGKPWKPDWEDESDKFTIEYFYNNINTDTIRNYESHLLAFPTKEMRDAFYENFKDLIEQCKELL